MLKKYFKIFIAILFSLVFIFYAFKDIDLVQLKISLQKIDLIPLIYITILFFFQIFLRAVRWKYLINSYQETNLMLRFDGIMLSSFLNYILPLRAGEFGRPAFLSKLSENKFPPVMLSVVLERLFDLLMVLLSFLFLVFFSKFIFSNAIIYTASIFGFIAFGIIITLVLTIFYIDFFKKMILFFTNFLPSRFGNLIRDFFDKIIESTLVLKNKKNIINILFLSVLIWLITFIQYDLAYLIIGDKYFPWFGILTTVIISLAVAAPSAPGFIGVYQGGILLAFNLMNLSKEDAAVFSIVTHLHQYVLIIFYGIYIFLNYKLSFKDFRK